MRFNPFLKFVRLKLHTKTTILISALMVIIFAVIAYFADLAISRLNAQREHQEAQLLATRVASIVEHHIKRETRRRKRNGQPSTGENIETIPVPDWSEVQDEIYETIVIAYKELAEVRVFYKPDSGIWNDKIRIPGDARSDIPDDMPVAPHDLVNSEVVQTYRHDHIVSILAMSPVISSFDADQAQQIGAVSVLLAFDESKSSAARLRSLIWPLMLLGIIALTLITYFLFRYIIYEPVGGLLLAMSRAEEGNLSVEVKPFAPDEIGMLTSRFNRMLGRIRVMTEQLNLEHRLLEDRVQEATSEIAARKGQLEEANLRLFELQRQLMQLERLAAAGQLAAQFAHEVGTPLNLISGHVQLLRARATDERVIKRLDVIAGQIERIANIVRSMLDSTRRPGPNLETVDINSLLARILDAAHPTLMARNVELRMEMAADLPHIEADPDQMQQVFINLINNSLDAMPGGGRIRVGTKLKGDSIIVELADDGEGIAPDRINLIFDPLFTTKRGVGTGLGLTIVKQIVKEHGGEIELDSEPQRGTVFKIVLPIQPRNDRFVSAKGIAIETPETAPAESGQEAAGPPVSDRDVRVGK